MTHRAQENIKQYNNTTPITRYTYGYDSVGNRLMMIDGSSTINYYYNSLNQLDHTTLNGADDFNFPYDDNRNLIGKSNGDDYVHYDWNHNNLMIEADSNTWASTPWKYSYDATGQRIKKSYNDGEFTYETNYFYDGINVLMEKYHSTEGPTSFTKAAYTLSPGLIGHIVSVRQINSGSTTDFWYHYDPIGNVLFLTDSTGTMHTSYVQEGFIIKNLSFQLSFKSSKGTDLPRFWICLFSKVCR